MDECETVQTTSDMFNPLQSLLHKLHIIFAFIIFVFYNKDIAYFLQYYYQ